MNNKMSGPSNNSGQIERMTCKFNNPLCVDAAKYKKVVKIGEGTFGKVFKARERAIPAPYSFVAMKKVFVKNKKEGLPITAQREIRILQYLKHENVIKLIETCQIKPSASNSYHSSFYMVLEFCEHDLSGLLANEHVTFYLGEIKHTIQQLLTGLHYVHCKKILHRDLKPANILINKDGILKLADFGLARLHTMPRIGPIPKYTNTVVTLWYRAPELLLGGSVYGPPIDLWGVGCIMAEMWIRSPIMQGCTELHQLLLISHFCGSYSPEVWPGVVKLPFFPKLQFLKHQNRRLTDLLSPYIDALGCNLIDNFLQLDPRKRCDSYTALNHEFFRTDPLPTHLGKMLKGHTTSMYDYLSPPKKPKLHIRFDFEDQRIDANGFIF